MFSLFAQFKNFSVFLFFVNFKYKTHQTSYSMQHVPVCTNKLSPQLKADKAKTVVPKAATSTPMDFKC